MTSDGRDRVVSTIAVESEIGAATAIRASRWMSICLGAIIILAAGRPLSAETLPEALVRAYQSNPQLNADRARQRGTDENVPQALSGYRPQIVASLSAGLQAVRNILPNNTIQGTTLRPWTIGLTVTQVLFNGNKTANSVRVAEFQVLSGREALRNTGQGVLLDAVTAYMNVLANQALVESQRTNVTVLREIQETTKKRLAAGDVTPTDTAQAEARLSRGLADLNAAEVALDISKALYVLVIGPPPSQLAAAIPVDRFSPVTISASIETAAHEHPAVLGTPHEGREACESPLQTGDDGVRPHHCRCGGTACRAAPSHLADRSRNQADQRLLLRLRALGRRRLAH
jgi:outer membrane protein